MKVTLGVRAALPTLLVLPAFLPLAPVSAHTGATEVCISARNAAAGEGGYEGSGLDLMDNSRLVEELEIQYAPFPQRVMETINEVRRAEGLPPVG